MEDKALIFNIQKFSLNDGPGIRTVVFFKGCPLRCFWCSNPESQSGKPEEMFDNTLNKMTTVGEYKSMDEIIHEVMKDEMFYEESGGGVTLSGGEVLSQASFATELLKNLKAKGIHTCCETTGFAKEDVFREFSKYVDLMYMDIKHHDPLKHKQGTGSDLNVVLNNLKVALELNINLIVRIPVIPNYNDSPDDALEFARLFNEMNVKKVELLPFHQYGEKKYTYLNREYTLEHLPQLHTEDLDDYKEILENNGITTHVE
ncbi:MAG: glycyl-radical enzyme activating protein [Streptococcaceae bacterium]|nr:glycyl-radical enzyme activating protein [Streptococcaceae bacterium]